MFDVGLVVEAGVHFDNQICDQMGVGCLLFLSCLVAGHVVSSMSLSPPARWSVCMQVMKMVGLQSGEGLGPVL